MQIFLGFIAGVVSYLVTTFIMEPIVRYRNVRHEILRDLVLYAGAIFDRPGERDATVDERRAKNRLNSAELQAVIVRLPWFYKEWLVYRGEDPQLAAENLIGLSNKTQGDQIGERENADRNVRAIKKALRADSLAV